MKKITLEEHFISPAYAQHVHELQNKAARAGTPSEFEALLADPVMRKGIEAVEAKLLDMGEGRLKAMDACGIDMQVLSLSALTFPSIQGESDTNQAVGMARKTWAAEVLPASPALPPCPYKTPGSLPMSLNAR